MARHLRGPFRAQIAIDRFSGNAYDLVIEGESNRGRQKPAIPGTAPAPRPSTRGRAGAVDAPSEAAG